MWRSQSHCLFIRSLLWTQILWSLVDGVRSLVEGLTAGVNVGLAASPCSLCQRETDDIGKGWISVSLCWYSYSICGTFRFGEVLLWILLDWVHWTTLGNNVVGCCYSRISSYFTFEETTNCKWCNQLAVLCTSWAAACEINIVPWRRRTTASHYHPVD